MSVFQTQEATILDDTIPLTCIFENTETIKNYTEFIIRVQRGPLKDNSWQIRRRYSDFVALCEALKISGMEIPLPPKKLLGNMEREFIAERQRGLQSMINYILANPMLASSIIVKKFLDENNYNVVYSEKALQNVSLFFRSETKWEMVEPMKDMGWRIKKCYFLIKPRDNPKNRLFLTWMDHPPIQHLLSKDLDSMFKLLPNLQHPSIYPVLHASSNESGAITIKNMSPNGSLRDIFCKAKPMKKLHFLKKYCNPKAVDKLQYADIKQFGRQILEMLKFLHDKGLACHHLHSGNIVVEERVCKLVDIENYFFSLPPYYKPFYSQFRKIHSSESIDVYSFGQLLYEMTFGRPLNKPTIIDLSQDVPAEIRSVLESILTNEACKLGVPSLEGLLSHPLFADEVVITVGVKPTLKIPSKLKETLRTFKDSQEKTLREEQKVLSQFKRLSKAKAHHSSDGERQRRKMEARRKSSKKLNEVKEENVEINNKITNNKDAATSAMINSQTALL